MNRACLIACTVVIAATASWSAPGDAVPGIANGRIRIEANIPGYLKLSLQSEGTPLGAPDPMGLRQIAVRAEANTPWVLLATLRGGSSETECIVRQAGQSGWLPLSVGATTVIPCQVNHFAGKHDIALEWQVLPGTTDDAKLELKIAPDGLAADALYKAPREVQIAWALPTAPFAHAPLPADMYTPAIITR